MKTKTVLRWAVIKNGNLVGECLTEDKEYATAKANKTNAWQALKSVSLPKAKVIKVKISYQIPK